MYVVDNIKLDLREIENDDNDWICHVEDYCEHANER
jgi:hypothetical protein